MAEQSLTPVLIITGTVGVGKSSVADEVYEILKKRSAHVALINLDELGYVGFTPENDPFNRKLRFKNLQTVWQNYQEAGAKGVVIPYLVEDRKIVDGFTNAIPDSEIYIVRLDAQLSTIEERIRNRPMGGSVEWHLQRATELTETFKNSQPEDIVINTEEKSISEVAEEIIERWPFTPSTHNKLD